MSTLKIECENFADDVELEIVRNYNDSIDVWLAIEPCGEEDKRASALMNIAEATKLRDALVDLIPLEAPKKKKKNPKGPQAYKGNGKHKWEHVTDLTDRLRVPGGWLYNDGCSTVFVPVPDTVGYAI